MGVRVKPVFDVNMPPMEGKVAAYYSMETVVNGPYLPFRGLCLAQHSFRKAAVLPTRCILANVMELA